MNTNCTGLLAAGNWIVDTTKLIDVYPSQDTLANILTQERSNGGGAFNILIDLARLGAKFPLQGLGLVGSDPEGEWIRSECAAYGINAAQLHSHPSAATSYTDVMTVQSSGRRTFFHQRGANAFLGPEHFAWDTIESRIFYLGYILLLDRLDAPDPDYGIVAGRVLSEAGRKGLYRVVDLVSAESADYSIVKAALPEMELLICNELEAERVTGLTLRDGAGQLDHQALHRATRVLLDLGVRDWVVIHMPEGACAESAAGEFVYQGSVRIEDELIKGAVGAGDAFAAGVLLGLHEQMAMSECLRYGVCTAAACLQDSTSSRGIPALSECLALGDLNGYRGETV